MRGHVRSFQGIAVGILMSSALAVVSCSSNSETAPSSGSPSPGIGDGTSGNPITVFITNSVYSPNPLSVKVGHT